MKEFFPSIIKKDIVYTPELFSKIIIKKLKIEGVCLDPCRGRGSFYNNLPKGSLYCEITENLDFFDFNKKVDWIIGNPPLFYFYKIFRTFF